MVRAAGLTAAADEMEIFAEQEWHHGVVIENLLRKYAPEHLNSKGKKWVCQVCGYEHTGDEPPECCPVCGQPKKDFKQLDTAPVQVENADAPAQKVFVCTICGYEHFGDAPPDVCPICGQPASVFKEKSL